MKYKNVYKSAKINMNAHILDKKHTYILVMMDQKYERAHFVLYKQTFPWKWVVWWLKITQSKHSRVYGEDQNGHLVAHDVCTHCNWCFNKRWKFNPISIY